MPVGAFGGGEIAGLEFKPAVPEQAFGIFRIEHYGARIGFARALRIAQARDGAEIAPRGRGLLAVLPDAGLRLRNGRRFFIGNRAKQFRGVFDVAGLEQVERLLQARIARGGACGDVRHGGADRLLTAGRGRRLACRDELLVPALAAVSVAKRSRIAPERTSLARLSGLVNVPPG